MLNETIIKAHLFDAEQALRWAREAIEARDPAALNEALAQVRTEIDAAAMAIIPLG
jgi:hypothetical protein